MRADEWKDEEKGPGGGGEVSEQSLLKKSIQHCIFARRSSAILKADTTQALTHTHTHTVDARYAIGTLIHIFLTIHISHTRGSRVP